MKYAKGELKTNMSGTSTSPFPKTGFRGNVIFGELQGNPGNGASGATAVIKNPLISGDADIIHLNDPALDDRDGDGMPVKGRGR